MISPGILNIDSSISNLHLPCKVCNKPIVRDQKVICTACGTGYHPGCAAPIKVLPSGALQRCCGPVNKRSGKLSPSAVVTLSGDDRAQLFDELKTTVRDEIKMEVMGAMKEALGEELKTDLMRVLTNAVGTAVGKAFEGVNNKLRQDLSVLGTSVEELQEAREFNDAQILGLSTDLGTVSTRLDSVEQEATNRNEKIMGEIKLMREEIAARVSAGGAEEGLTVPRVPEQYLDEVEDRLSRKRNVIMFGVPEAVGGDAHARKIKDTDAVSGLLAALSVKENMNSVICSRLGKFSLNLAHPRPLKVVLSTCDVASNVIMIASQKRTRAEISAALGQVTILPDQTESQRLRYKQLKLELARRKESEENPNLKIITRNGVPRIVSWAPRMQRGSPVERQVLPSLRWFSG